MHDDHALIVTTFWVTWISLLILVEVHVVFPLLRAGERHRNRVLNKARADVSTQETTDG